MKISKKFAALAVTSLLTTSMTTSAFADPVGDSLISTTNVILFKIYASITSHWQQVPGLIGNTVMPPLNFVTHLMFAKTPGIGQTMVSFSSLPQANDYAYNSPGLQTDVFGKPFSYPGINNDKPIPFYSGGQAYTQDELSQMFRGSIAPSSSLRLNYFKTFPENLGGYVNNQIYNNDAPLNAATLFGNDATTGNFNNNATYTPDQDAQAKLYITFASGAGFAMRAPGSWEWPSASSDISSLSTQDRIKALSNDWVEYNMQYNTLASIQSFDAYNLSHIYAEHKALLAPTNIKDLSSAKVISAAGLMQYLHTDKATNPNWYKAMAVASPFAVTREILNFTAGSFMSLYRIEQTNQKILAAISMNNTLQIMMLQQFIKLNLSQANAGS